MTTRTGLLTVGHGTLDREGLTALLQGAGVAELVDVRRFPGSRRHPDVSREALEEWLPEAGIDYRWEERLGGRRRLAPDLVSAGGSPDDWWKVVQFRAFAAHTRTSEFAEALEGVLDDAEQRVVAVMCSESVWWRCHRRLIADVAVVGRGVGVQHLMHTGKLTPHPPAAGARRQADGTLVWDVDSGPWQG